ncbi:MAG: arginine--tRNA ligase [Chloroflexi bacterium GWC2_73_18]|nr:MAG: arginine--tRNA ligase [Chloroflexi bacterium GWC2_73_18]
MTTDRPIRTLVRGAVAAAWARAVTAGALPPLPEGTPTPGVEVERPADPAHGDFASNLALRLARPCRRPPLEIARALADALADGAPDASGRRLLGAAEAAAPGFLNLRLDDALIARQVDAILAAGPAYGRVASDEAEWFNVEFVSANPTGPLHIGNARGAFVGDSLSRLLEAAGHRVTREYYFNDFGSQIRELGESVRVARAGGPMDEAPYRGDYVLELAADAPDEVVREAEAPGGDAAWAYGAWASEWIRAGIEATMGRLGCHFDVWRSEGTLHRDGWIARGVERLRSSGDLYESEGALWFRSTAYGDDKDRVVRRSNGEYTYFAADIGYLVDKFSRGFDHLVYVWGEDHHGTVARVRNAAQALGYRPESVEMLLYSWVRFLRDGAPVGMSKRGGTFITLDELLDEVGVDAARWFFASRGHTSPLDFDIELAKRQAPENPVYYVQYAHARISSILRVAREKGLSAEGGDTTLLRDPIELGLARALLRLPEVVEDGAAAHEYHELTAYAQELAAVFHAFYRDRRVVDAAAPDVSRARLALVDAARQTIACALGLLGISAPESM